MKDWVSDLFNASTSDWTPMSVKSMVCVLYAPFSSQPEVLSRCDIERMRHSSALFARKFDLSADPEIFEVIDSVCLTESVVHEEVKWNA